MGTGYKNRGSGAAGLGFKNRGAKLVEGAAYTNRGATDGVNEAFKNRGQAWGSDAYYNRGPNDFASLSVLGLAEFYAPLTSSLILTRGTGDPTYSRATKAWEFGYAADANAGADQVLIEVATGTPRFGGARYDSGTWYNTYADGSTISESSLLGYHAEGARTNSLMDSRDLQKAWVQAVSVGSEIAPDITDIDTTAYSWGVAGTSYGSTVSVVSGKLRVTKTQAIGQASIQNSGVLAGLPVTVGKTYTVTVSTGTRTGSGNWDARIGTNNEGFQYLRLNTLTENSSQSGTFVATTGTVFVSLMSGGGTSGDYNDWAGVTIKEAAIQVTTCTGIDNAANSASTLTAGAADATILQTLSLAAAARSFSAYVKRRTGTGSVYITRDGGTNWTDITSSLGASWTRVKIENTSVLNPSVGFKIATSGDAIDVDVCQDEAGAFITSPIITTSAAVTRNADTLNYPKASNLNNTAGTALLSWSISQTGATVSGTQVPLLIDANGFLAYIYSGAGFDIARSYDGTAVAESSGLSRKSTSRKQATNWTGATQKTITEGAAAVDSDTYDGTWGAGSTIQIGQVDAFFGYVRNAYIWSTALTDAQLQQVTA